MAISSIVQSICQNQALSFAMAEWLIGHFSEDSFAYKQLATYLFMENPQASWQEKLQRAIQNKSNWAIRRIIDIAPFDFLDEAVRVIQQSEMPKGNKNLSVRLIDDRRKAAKSK